MKISQMQFRQADILQALPARERNWVAEQSRLKRLKTGKTLFAEGSYPRHVYILRKGRVKIFQTTPGGNEQIVHIYEPGSLFGYRPILCSERHPVTAQTLEESAVLVLSRLKFLELFHQSKALSGQLLRSLSSEFSVWISRLTAFAQYSVKERMALLLLSLSERYSEGTFPGISVTLMRRDLASLAGTSIETLARVLHQWKRDKIIETRGRQIVIRNSTRLLELVE